MNQYVSVKASSSWTTHQDFLVTLTCHNHFSFFHKVTAADSFSHEIENFSLRQAIRRKSIQVCSQYYITDTQQLTVQTETLNPAFHPTGDGFLSVRQSATSEANKKGLDYHHHWGSRRGQRTIPQICWKGTKHLVGKVLPEAQQGINHSSCTIKYHGEQKGKKRALKKQLLKNSLFQTFVSSTEMGNTVRWEGFTGPSSGKLQEHSGERRRWSGSGAVGLAETHLQRGEGQKENWSKLILFLFYFSCSHCTVLLLSSKAVQ